MGGENLLTYTTGCDINLSGTGDRNGPATFTVSSFSNVNPRTVELSKEAGQPVVLSFKNPEKYIFEPVGCGSLSAVVVLVALLVLMIEDIMVAGVVKFIMSINLQNLSLRIIMERVAI